LDVAFGLTKRTAHLQELLERRSVFLSNLIVNHFVNISLVLFHKVSQEFVLLDTLHVVRIVFSVKSAVLGRVHKLTLVGQVDVRQLDLQVSTSQLLDVSDNLKPRLAVI